MILKLINNRKGQGLVEYGLLIAGVALICAAAVSIFGHKTSDLIAAVATVLPGVHADDNGSIQSGKLIETTAAGDDAGTAGTGAALDVTTIAANNGTARLGVNVGLGASATNFGNLVNEAQ